jgi:PAS domain S-box-containing protein
MNMDSLSALNFNEKIQVITLTFLTIFCVFLEIILHFYLGISTGYTHFFYILLVLAAIWYQRRAVILAFCLAVTHFSIGYFVFDEPLWVPFLRSAMFVLVTLLVGIMAEGLKKAEAAVCAKSNEWELTFNSTSDGICLLDKDQKIQRCNQSMVDIVDGIPVQDLVSKPCWTVVHNTNGPIMECPFIVAKKTLMRQTIDVLERNKWFEITVDPILDDSGIFTGAVHIMRDITERKVMEESLRQSHQILQTILDTIPVRVFWKDHDLKYLGCNRPFAQDAGFTEPNDLIGKDDYVMGWRDQAEIYRSDDRSVIASGKANVMIEEPQTTPDGKIIWLLTSKVPLRDAAGEISGVLGTYMDISEYRNAREAIRESEEKYRAFFATSKDCVFITSKDGRFEDFNDETPAFFGYRDRKEIEMINVRDLYNNARQREEHVRTIAQSGFVKDYPVDLRRKDGTIIHALVTSIARKDDSGNVIGFQGTIKDITEQKRAEAALRESFAIFKTVMDSLDALVYVADMKTYEILFVNQYGRKIWGDLTGKICWKSLQVNQKGPCPFCTNEKLLDLDGNPAEILIWEFRNTINGHSYECHDSAIRWTDGRIVRIEIASDITERKRAEAALKESNERYISFIKEAAMRLKTPVEVVERNITTVIKDINTGDIDNTQVLLQLQIQVKNMKQIRQNILDLNKTIVDGYGEISPATKKFLTE